MGERDLEYSTSEAMDDGYEPGADDISEDMLQGIAPLSSEKQQLVQRRRLAEQRLEEKRYAMSSETMIYSWITTRR